MCFVVGRIALLIGEITVLHISSQLFKEMVSIFIILLGMLADCACHVAASFGRKFRICCGSRGRAALMIFSSGSNDNEVTRSFYV